MKKKIFCLALGAMISTLSFPAEAQQSKKVYRVGFLRGAAPPESYIEAFRQSLKDLGYVEGRNITIECRYMTGERNQLPDLVTELLRLQVDVIVADGSVPTEAAKNATRIIPIVMQSGNPVELGSSLALRGPAETSRA